MMGFTEIIANTRRVQARIAAACERVARPSDAVTLIAVSKTRSVPDIEAAHLGGVRDFGENRVQEALPKIDALREHATDATWHLIGNLQRNKVGAAISRFDILHTVDSERLAEAISGRAEAPIRVLIEVNVAGEASKHGVAPEDVSALAGRMARMPNIELLGLMTVAPRADDPEDIRPVFRKLREIRDGLGLRELSMGMTDDFEVAIEEGATMVRVGRAIFGARGEQA
jgi:pyridoxal phosphate enzyme (YggS family)